MRNIARVPCGRWTKWAVLGAWLVVFVVAGPLAGELNGVEKNDPADALPKNAESTRVVELAKQFTPSDTVPALVVYERRGAASAADQAKVAGDVRRYAGIDNIGGQVVGPILAKDGAAFQVVVPIRAGDKGSEAIVAAVEQIRAIARDGDGTSSLRVYVTGPAGYEAAFDDVFKGIDSSLLYITAAIGARIARRPRLVWLVTAVVLGAVAFGMTGLRTNDLQLKDSFRTRPEAVTGEQALARHFPAGAGSPVQVIGRSAAAPQLQAALAATPGVTAIGAPVTRDGFSYVEGTLTSSPDSQASFATVDRLRSRVHAIAGADGLVGGGSAINLDTQRAARHDRNLVVPLVLVVVFVILAVLLRALVAPLLLVGTVVLSFAAALGVSTLVFDHVFHFAGSFPAFPLYAFVFLVALGVDYNIFLMTRVREESRRHGTRRGALIGLAATGGVITSAGLVLAGTFMALGSLPVVLATEIGFVVAFGVLLDTFVVRSVLVTALNLDVGRWLWWPSGRDRWRDVNLDQLEDAQTAALVP
jgi:uncharacterized membrane protein YdfJ with MMPL/SSD domain